MQTPVHPLQRPARQRRWRLLSALRGWATARRERRGAWGGVRRR